MNKQQISRILFDLDPMNTSCVENDMFDEYDDVASLIHEGFSVRHAFNKQFWKDCLNSKHVKVIEEAIRALD